MKTYLFKALGLLIVSTTLFLAGCKEDPDASETEVEMVTRLLTAGKWNLQSVTVDGVNQDALFSGLKLTFTSNALNAEAPGPIWPQTTSWSFAGGGAQQLETASGLLISIDAIEDNSLKLSLNWSKTTLNGKVGSVKGQHVFTFTR